MPPGVFGTKVSLLCDEIQLRRWPDPELPRVGRKAGARARVRVVLGVTLDAQSGFII
jgi:hypothetical protein